MTKDDILFKLNNFFKILDLTISVEANKGLVDMKYCEELMEIRRNLQIDVLRPLYYIKIPITSLEESKHIADLLTDANRLYKHFLSIKK